MLKWFSCSRSQVTGTGTTSLPLRMFFFFLIRAIITCMNWHLTAVWICSVVFEAGSHYLTTPDWLELVTINLPASVSRVLGLQQYVHISQCLFFNLFHLLFMHVWALSVTAHVWRPEGNFHELILSCIYRWVASPALIISSAEPSHVYIGHCIPSFAEYLFKFFAYSYID